MHEYYLQDKIFKKTLHTNKTAVLKKMRIPSPIGIILKFSVDLLFKYKTKVKWSAVCFT